MLKVIGFVLALAIGTLCLAFCIVFFEAIFSKLRYLIKTRLMG